MKIEILASAGVRFVLTAIQGQALFHIGLRHISYSDILSRSLSLAGKAIKIALKKNRLIKTDRKLTTTSYIIHIPLLGMNEI